LVAAIKGIGVLVAIIAAAALASSCSSDDASPEDLPATLPNNWVTSQAVDPNGSLWVGTTDGLGHLSNESWTNYQALDGLPTDLVNTVAVTDDGLVWVGTNFGAGHLEAGS